jgi:hypothetical protein
LWFERNRGAQGKDGGEVKKYFDTKIALAADLQNLLS